MTTPKSTLFLFTHEYPYGTTEPFIENELRLLAKDFQTVYLFPLKKNGEARIMPADNIKIVNLFEKVHANKWKLLLRDFLFIIRVLFFELNNASSVPLFLKSFLALKSILLINLHRAKVLRRFIISSNKKNIVFYSFWTDDWATILSILKKKKMIRRFFTRGHGYDVYEERWEKGAIPFRHFQLENVCQFLTVSMNGLNYMINRYPKYQQKFKLCYLTIPYQGDNPFISNTSNFTIVSCSSLIPLKRVELIIEILKKIKFEVKWIHFGEGSLLNTLLAMTKQLPSNIAFEFMGAVSNKQLIEYYKNNSINLFISTSSTEGLPITIQEAISFGIPVLATDVGGTSEIVNRSTGILIEKDFDPQKVACLINNFKDGPMNTFEFRKGVKAFWEKTFSAFNNYPTFCELLKMKNN